jgi:hypothetical protein
MLNGTENKVNTPPSAGQTAEKHGTENSDDPNRLEKLGAPGLAFETWEATKADSPFI